MSCHARRVVPLLSLLLIAFTIAAPDFPALERATARVFVESSPPHSGVPDFFEVVIPREEVGDAAARQLAARPPATALPGEGAQAGPAASPKAPSRGALLSSLYGSFAALQALDAHSTLLAVDRGATEVNPLVGSLAGAPAGLIAVKAGTAAGVIYMTERVRRHSRVAAVILMVASNSAYATIVAHNYRVAERLR